MSVRPELWKLLADACRLSDGGNERDTLRRLARERGIALADAQERDLTNRIKAQRQADLEHD